MHKCKRSKCAVWAKDCELLSGENIRELNIDEQLFFFFSATQVYFVIKLAPTTANQVGLALQHCLLG